MNRDQLKKHWEVVKAFKNGAEIEMKGDYPDAEWKLNSDPCFYTAISYRIKPEPTGSDKVRELLETSNKHVLCSVSDVNQETANKSTIYTLIHAFRNGVFYTDTSSYWRYASLVDMTGVARWEK